MNSDRFRPQDFVAKIRIDEEFGYARVNEAIRLGVPFPRGLIYDAAEIAMSDSHERKIAHQCRVLANWPDRSIKWMLLDALVCVERNECAQFSLIRNDHAKEQKKADPAPELRIFEAAEQFVVDTGAVKVVVARATSSSISSVQLGSIEFLAIGGLYTSLRTTNGDEYRAVIDRVQVEESGLLRASFVTEGGFVHEGRRSPILFKSRLVFVAGSALVQLEFQLRNPQAAHHVGGLWDLGDAGSCTFSDLSIYIQPGRPTFGVQWYPDLVSISDAQHSNYSRFVFYQDSSGGEHWDSPNHVDSANNPTVSFSGYQIKAGSSGEFKLIGEGSRATPCLRVMTDNGWIAIATRNFWQNFPKAIRLDDGLLSIGLFPAECAADFELQGGEQKRHVVYLDFGPHGHDSTIPLMQSPLEVSVDPLWIEQTRVIPWFGAAERDANRRCAEYVDSIVEGPNSFLRKREVVDEYGWRNFGDLYADHETVRHQGPKPMVSHYNNQYDFIFGALIQFLRTGDHRWYSLMDDAARHTVDIDIYHTTEDRAVYSGGLFWHTDHYKDAATCSHRTYSRKNGSDGYGGGPSNEHNYTSGLLHYHYLSGDPEAATAVLELANWVIAMDDGSRNLFGLIDSGPTGIASMTVTDNYHGPGRGAGNSINALLDGYKLSDDRKFMCKAEELIQRCIHPSDDVKALGLDAPEYRWSYLVFLQTMCKYLDLKLELGECDYHYSYAKESLLHYSEWMLDNEVPFKDVLHKVELPTETWPAHDIRKCHVLHVAAIYASPVVSAKMSKRAEYFFKRCIEDTLSFKTAYLTRPLVILCVYGHIHSFFQRGVLCPIADSRQTYYFGVPQTFQAQRHRLKVEFLRKVRMATNEIKRLLLGRLNGLRNRFGFRR